MTLKIRDENTTTLIIINNTNPNFPPTLTKRIFEHFYQIDDDKQQTHNDTNIKLTLTHELTKLHNNEI